MHLILTQIYKIEILSDLILEFLPPEIFDILTNLHDFPVSIFTKFDKTDVPEH